MLTTAQPTIEGGNTMHKCHVTDPIMLGGERLEPGSIVELQPREYAHLFRLGAVEPEEVYFARRRALETSAKAKAEADRVYAEVMATESKEIGEATPVARPEKFDAAKSEAERAEASKRARGAKPAPASA
jgi:hypothetical protein